MPTYEYRCKACAHLWEAEQSIRAAALTECPACHGATAKRQISHSTGFGKAGMASLGGAGSSSLPARSPAPPPGGSDCCGKR
jgi:putative FmdB family regulatory protein